MKMLGKLFLILAAVILGFIQGSLYFADYAAGENEITRLMTSTFLAVAISTPIGYVYKKHWWLAIVSVWMPALFLVAGFFKSFQLGLPAANFLTLTTLVLPISVALLAGFGGHNIKHTKSPKPLIATIALSLASLFAVIAYVTSRG